VTCVPGASLKGSPRDVAYGTTAPYSPPGWSCMESWGHRKNKSREGTTTSERKLKSRYRACDWCKNVLGENLIDNILIQIKCVILSLFLSLLVRSNLHSYLG
jgi:hypothetical protein